MRRIILIRHSIPETGGVRKCIGSGSDPGLSAEGVALCGKTRILTDTFKADNIYTSPLVRARETASLLFPSENITVIEDLREIHMGVWDGLSFDQIRRNFPGLYKKRGDDPSLLPEGSEGWEEVSARMERAVLSTEGDCIAVSHAGAIKSLIIRLSGADFKAIGDFKLDYCGIITVFEDSGKLYARHHPEQL